MMNHIIQAISQGHVGTNLEQRESYLYGFVGDKHNLTRKQILQEFTDVRLFDMNRFLNQTYHPFTIKEQILRKSLYWPIHTVHMTRIAGRTAGVQKAGDSID